MSDTQQPWPNERPGSPIPPPQPRPASGTAPTFQQPNHQQATFQPGPGQPGFGPQPSQGLPPHPPTPAPSRKRGTGKLVAGFLGVALVAGGVGAGSAILADRYLTDDTAPAISQPAEQQEPGEDGQPSTTVSQANPVAPDWSAVADVASKSVVAIQTASRGGAGQGSGVVIDKDGHVVSNHHVVGSADHILVTLGARTYQAKLVGTDAATDLAVIKLVDPPSDLQPMAWGDSNAVGVGDPVMAIGNPLGLSNTVTTGIVSALDRPVTTRNEGSDDLVITAAIQTNAAINPGNSGGALTNASGELIGITSSIASMSGQQGQPSGNIGIGFAIPADQAKHVTQQLIEQGEAVYPQLGVTATDVRQVGPMGAVVATVAPGSPAAKAGLKVDDIITGVNGRTVQSMSQLVGIIRAQKVGEPIEVSYVRGDQEGTATATLVASGS